MDSSGILYGLVAAFCWGTADFCARGATRLAGTFMTLLCIQIVAVTGLLVVCLPLGLLQPHAPSVGMVLYAAALNLWIMGGAALLYRAFAIGTLALVSPVAASFAAITALLAILTGEHPTSAQFVGIGATLVGVVLASTVSGAAVAEAEHDTGHDTPPRTLAAKRSRGRLAPGLPEALAAMVVFGVAYWALRVPADALGGIPVVFIGKVSDLIVLGSIALVGGLRLRRRGSTRLAGQAAPWYAVTRPAPIFWAFLVPNALLDTSANIAYNVGISTSLIAIVSVISSLFSAVTVVLAWIFLHERLALWQWVGVGSIFLGVALVSL